MNVSYPALASCWGGVWRSNGAGVSGPAARSVPDTTSRASRRHSGPSAATAISSSSYQASRALWVRSLGSFTSSRSIQSEKRRSTLGSTVIAEGISSLTCRIRTATGVVESWKGTRSTVIS